MLKSGLFKQIVLLWALPIQLFSFIPAIYLNDLQKPFEAIGKPYLNPTLGFIFATRLASQMRFYGCYEFGFKENGQREFVADKGQDGVFRLIRELFPSTGGNLSTESTAMNNFGNVLKHGSAVERIDLIVEILVDIDLIRQGVKDSCLGTNSKQGLVHKFPKPKDDNGNRSACFKKLRLAILAALQGEKQGLYPQYFVEQIILGFFWHHFNTAQDLEMLVNLLLQKSGTAWQARPFTLEQLEVLQAKAVESPASLSLEECLQLSYFPDFFAKITPYAKGETLISNGISNLVQRDKAGVSHVLDILNSAGDCVEAVVKHLVNLLVYNPSPDVKDFNHANIRSYSNPDLARFYGSGLTSDADQCKSVVQTVEQVNNGSLAIRNAWNCVIADLNHSSLSQVDRQGNRLAPVQYRQKSSIFQHENNNELSPGLINIANVLSRILNLPLITLQFKEQILAAPEKHIEELTAIFTDLLAKGFLQVENVQINLVEQTNEEIYGSLSFDVRYGNLTQSFCLSVSSEHAQLYNLDSPTIGQNRPTLQFPLNSALQDTLACLKLLIPEWSQSLQATQPTAIIYYLYGQPMQDNFGKIDFLKRMLACRACALIDQIDKSASKQLIKEITWQDHAVFENGWPMLLEFLKRKFPDLGIGIEPNSNYFARNLMAYMQDNPTELLIEMNKNVKAITLYSTCLSISEQLLEQLAKIYPQLKKLNLGGLGGLTELPALPAILEELEISNCWQLISLEGLTVYSQLKTLKLCNLNSLNPLPVLPAGLEELEVSFCLGLVEFWERLTVCSQLKTLKLNGLPSLTELPALPASLEELEISACSELSSLERLRDCQQLKKLRLYDLASLDQLPVLLASLEELEISVCSELSSLDRLRDCQQLKKLRLQGLVCLNQLPALPASLEELELLGRYSLTALEQLTGLSQLKKLTLDSIAGLDQLPALPASLEELEILVCSKLNSLEGLSDCQQLKKLRLQGLVCLNQLPALPASLEELEISVSFAFNFLEGLNGCQQLKILKINRLGGVTKLPALPASLEKLEISVCSALRSLEGLNGCSQLKKLKLDVLGGLIELPVLPASLEELEISVCPELRSLEGLNGCSQLKKLKLDALGDLTLLQLPASLKDLRIGSSDILVKLFSSTSWPWPELTHITIKDINPLLLEFTSSYSDNLDPRQDVESLQALQ